MCYKFEKKFLCPLLAVVASSVRPPSSLEDKLDKCNTSIAYISVHNLKDFIVISKPIHKIWEIFKA